MIKDKLKFKFHRAGLHAITEHVELALDKIIKNSQAKSNGMLYLFNPHTSSALTINEAFDPSANKDLTEFLNHLAPKNLSFIEHTLEGEDDSPAHMKTALLQPHLLLMVENGSLVLGRWQGIFLAEFRDHPPERMLLLKYLPDL